jgi:hypothetical protein
LHPGGSARPRIGPALALNSGDDSSITSQPLELQNRLYLKRLVS